MNVTLLDALSCVSCGAYPLDARVIEQRRQDIETGYLYCPSCHMFYFIKDGIPRMLPEDFAALVDTSVARDYPEAFSPKLAYLDDFLARLQSSSESAEAKWGVEDVDFWDRDEYGDDSRVTEILAQVERSRPDAGNRTYVRERHVFRYLRSGIHGKMVLDVGCGVGQTFRVLARPERLNYSYVGIDLSINALLASRRSLAGDFVQCSGTRLPFKPQSVDIIVLLGTLHHLHDAAGALGGMIQLLKPGGLIALHEVIGRRSESDPEVDTRVLTTKLSTFIR